MKKTATKTIIDIEAKKPDDECLAAGVCYRKRNGGLKRQVISIAARTSIFGSFSGVAWQTQYRRRLAKMFVAASAAWHIGVAGKTLPPPLRLGNWPHWPHIQKQKIIWYGWKEKLLRDHVA